MAEHNHHENEFEGEESLGVIAPWNPLFISVICIRLFSVGG